MGGCPIATVPSVAVTESEPIKPRPPFRARPRGLHPGQGHLHQRSPCRSLAAFGTEVLRSCTDATASNRIEGPSKNRDSGVMNANPTTNRRNASRRDMSARARNATVSSAPHRNTPRPFLEQGDAMAKKRRGARVGLVKHPQRVAHAEQDRHAEPGESGSPAHSKSLSCHPCPPGPSADTE